MFLFGGVGARESTEKAKCMHEQQDRGERRGGERRGGERRGKSERSTIFLKRTREGHRQSEQWNRFKGSGGERSERRGGAHMGFSERIDTALN